MTDDEAPTGARAPAVSVVVAVRDGARHLPALARMLDAQELRDFELVCVDDASTDETPEVLRAWSQGAEGAPAGVPVTVVPHAHQQGAAAGRRTGLRAARGRWVWFADVDDRFGPTTLARLVALATEHGADLVAARAAAETEDGAPSPVRLYGRDAAAEPRLLDVRGAADALFTGGVMGYLWDKLFSREQLLPVFDESIDLRTHEDLLLVLRLLAARPRVVVSAERVYGYVVRPASLSNLPVPSYPDLLRCAEAADDLVAATGPSPHHATFMTRYVGLSGIEDAARKGGPADVRAAVRACRDALGRASLRQVREAHGALMAGRVLAARTAPRAYARGYRAARDAVGALRARLR